MSDKTIALSFSLEKQMEIERIVMDEDSDAAIQLLKDLIKEFKKRNASHCGSPFDQI